MRARIHTQTDRQTDRQTDKERLLVIILYIAQ